MARYGSTVQSNLALFGLSYDAGDPLAPLYPLITARHAPPKADRGWYIVAESSMRARTVIYAETTAGDCGFSTGPTVEQQAGQFIGIAGNIAAPFTFGTSEILGPLTAVFTGPHTQAVAREKSTLCQASAQATAQIRAIDNAIRSGQASGAQGYAAMQQVASDYKAKVSPVLKGCNAACAMAAIVDCLVDESAYLYGVQKLPPMIPASAIGAPTGSAGAGDNVSLLARGVTSTPTGFATSPATPAFSAGAALGSGITFSPALIAIIVIALLIFFGLGVA